MKLKHFVKPLVSLVLLTLVLQLVDLHKLKDTLLGISPSVALLVVLGYTVGQVLSAYKWWLITKAGGINIAFLSALKSYFIGMFVNCFGLGIVGGDLTRGMLIAEKGGSKTVAITSVIADRAHGLAVLALLGTICAAFLGPNTLDPSWTYLLIIIGGGIVVGWFYGPSLLLKVVPETNRIRQKAKQISDVFPKKIGVVIYITIISALFHLLQITLHWVMGYGLGVSVPWTYLLVAIPFVNIASSLPISWHGLGVREAAYIFFLCPTVLREDQAVAFGAMWLLAVTASSALGGIVSFLTKDFRVFTSPENA